MIFDINKTYDPETQRQFENGVLPVLEKHGSEIGDKAMQGDPLCEEIIRRYHIFSLWLDPVNLAMLENNVRRWQQIKEH